MPAQPGYTKYNTHSSSGSPVATEAVTSLAGQKIDIGDVSVVRLTEILGVAPTSVTDTGGNTYALRGSSVVSAQVSSYLYTSRATTAMAAGYTVTANFASSAIRDSAMEIAVIGGVTSGDGFDKTVSARGTATAISSGATAALSSPSEVALTVIASTHAVAKTGSATEDSNISVVLNTSVFETQHLNTNGSTAAITSTGTESATGQWAIVVCTFQFVPRNRPPVMVRQAVNRGASF